MALKTLAGITYIDGFKVIRGKPDGMSWDEFDELRKEHPIHISDFMNTISFRIQDGPISENGVNGCQVDTMVATARQIIHGLNKEFPCRENALAITKLDEALMWLKERKTDRVKRGVEGTNQA